MIDQVRISFPEISAEDNARLVEQSDRERAMIPGTSLGVMQGGWASLKMPAEDWKSEAMSRIACQFTLQIAKHSFQVFEDRSIEEWGAPMRVWAWHVQLDQGESIGWHDHHQARWAGVYYPCPGRTLPSYLTFRAPGPQYLQIIPFEGMLITFPPTLEHAVRYPLENAQKFTRYSISFNLHPDDFKG